LVTKQGFCFVFDRETGEPVWPIEERPVPQSDIAGERTSPTQPFPTRPAPFEAQGVSAEDMLDLTPELHAEAVEIMTRYKIGPLYTPPVLADGKPGSYLGTLMLPGYGGGANWPGGAFDPETGLLFVPSRHMAMSSSLGVPDKSRTNLDYLRMETTVPAGPRGLPLNKPPWSRITAIDLNTGDHAWQIPNGTAPKSVRSHPDLQGLGLDFEKLGNIARPGVLVTKTLIFAGECGGLRGDPGEPYFRAFDKKTGEVVWKFDLPSKPTGAPMSYIWQGKQYIVVAVSTAEHPAELVALALP
jgi:quinoprotein glucose dehydrogenase